MKRLYIWLSFFALLSALSGCANDHASTQTASYHESFNEQLLILNDAVIVASTEDTSLDDSGIISISSESDVELSSNITHQKTHITCSNLPNTASHSSRLAFADYIIKNHLGYSNEQLTTLTDAQRIVLGYSPHIAIKSVLKPDGSTYRLIFSSNSTDNATATLDVTTPSTTTHKLSSISIQAQNVTCLPTTSILSGYFDHNDSELFTKNSNDHSFTYISKDASTGVRFELPDNEEKDTSLFAICFVHISNNNVVSDGAFNLQGIVTFKPDNLSYPENDEIIALSAPFNF